MNTSELVKEILLDSFSVHIKANYLLDECRRKAVKSKDKSYNHLFEYKSNRRNNWLIEIIHTKSQANYKVMVYYLNEHGINAICLDEDQQFLWYTPHFLKRYNERFLKQDTRSTLDLFKRFISVNRAGITERDPINQKILFRFTEGIGLGDSELINFQVTIYYLRTFISAQMVFDEQQHSIDKASEFYNEYCQEVQRKTGVKSL